MAKGIKQNNKKHKDSAKETFKSNKKAVVKLTKKKLNDNSKDLRILQAQQRKQNSVKKNAESDYAQRGNNNSAPLLCGIFPLFDFDNSDVIFSLLKRTDPEAKITDIVDIDGFEKLHSQSFVMNSKKFRKNFAFTVCRNFRDRFDYLDMAKVVDWAIFVLPNDFDELIGDYTEDLLAALIAQGLPSSCFCLVSDLDTKKKLLEKNFETITKLCLGDNKITQLTNGNEANKLMRHLSQNCKPSFIATSKSSVCSKSLNKKKGYFVCEHLKVDNEQKQLTIRGCMRGFGMQLGNSTMMHLTEIGDFPVQGATWYSPEDSNRSVGTNGKTWLRSDDSAVELNENVLNDDEMDAEDDEMDGDEEEMDEDEDIDEEDEESDEEVEDIGSDCDSENANDDKMSFASTAHTGYSLAQIQKFRESREDSMFPDEIEVECTVSASDKLRKYRGMNGFKSSVWPTNENHPDAYKDIHSFKKYKHDRNRVCNEMNKLQRTELENFIHPGSQFEIIIGNFSEQMQQKIVEILRENPKRHLIGSNLLSYEHRLSILHFNERRLSSVDDSAVNDLGNSEPSNDMTLALGEDSTTNGAIDPNLALAPKAEPIESKESMLFQVGFRRFTATPIYSEFSANSDLSGSEGKSKYCKFMEPKKNVVATVYGPVTYGPVPVLQFRLRQKDLGYNELSEPYIAELVATGSLLSIDPTRPIIKRVLLSGQIYKVNKRSVMVRYMFFNTDDIERFREVYLHSKKGIKGRIVKASGTHGYMKCCFDKPLDQSDVALMPLYKRVFPKCNTQKMYDHLPDTESLPHEVTEAPDYMMD